jgi:outer membrane protein OmpA-like peptidoglycan-associated protein
VVAVVAALCAVLVMSCSGGSSGSAKKGATTSPTESASPTVSTTTSSDPSETTDASEPSTTLPAGAETGLFDFNQDGTKEPTCATADFQAGLVVRTYCDDLSGYANEPATGATLVPGALLSLPTPADDPRDKPISEGASVAVLHLQSGQGDEIVVLTLSSDTVFAVGSDALQDPALDSLGNIAAGISSSYPGAAIEVRGHTDATGSASDNQSLSERRAAAVADYFATRGIDKSKLTSVGLGQTVPNYLETNPDGSDNTAGRDQNRRIEVVIRPA